MRFAEWKSLWRINRRIDVPHAAVAVMTPYCFVRALWYYSDQQLKAWPSQYETGVVLGWRWPWKKTFREKKWMRHHPMPMALYAAGDLVYMARIAGELGIQVPTSQSIESIRYVGPTVREILNRQPKCGHNYWTADCRQCARKAFLYAMEMKAKYEPIRIESESDRLQRQARERLTAHRDALITGRKDLPDGQS